MRKYYCKQVNEVSGVIPENVRFVIDALEKGGYEAYIVGGCVRDMLMGRSPHDYDITTGARPEQIKECFPSSKVIETGIKHGTVTIVSGGENIEVTTFRTDGEYKDHRRPESVSFSDRLSDDLSRRDLTVNAMAYSDRTGIIDLFGGERDLREHLIRCVGDPRLRFEEDALRIMRALRFASVLGFDIHEDTAAAVREMKGLLDAVSRERISSELEKLLCGCDVYEILTAFPGVFVRIVPELSDTVDNGRWELAARRIKCSPNDRLIRLALLLCEASAPAGSILRALKTDRHTFSTANFLVSHHKDIPAADMPSAKRLLRDSGKERAFLLADMIGSIALADGDAKRVSEVQKMRSLLNEIISSGQCYSADTLAFDGKDAAEAGFTGKGIGKIIAYLLDEVIDGKLPNEHEVLYAAAQSLAQSLCGHYADLHDDRH